MAVVGRRRFLRLVVVGTGAALVAFGLRRLGVLGDLRARVSNALRPSLDPQAPTGTLAPAELATLVAFAEVVVAGESISGIGRDAVRTVLARDAEERPGYQALCADASRLLDELAGGAFVALPLADRIALVARQRLGLPVGRLELFRLGSRRPLIVRDVLVPELLTAYYDSPAGWADVGYRRPYGECGDGRAYTSRPA